MKIDVLQIRVAIEHFEWGANIKYVKCVLKTDNNVLESMTPQLTIPFQLINECVHRKVVKVCMILLNSQASVYPILSKMVPAVSPPASGYRAASTLNGYVICLKSDLPFVRPHINARPPGFLKCGRYGLEVYSLF